uniref:Uncharacterized protein n=1 Tax=Arundo donax TaxID=35708 RepID=A0A0A9CJ00_ARUDO
MHSLDSTVCFSSFTLELDNPMEACFCATLNCFAGLKKYMDCPFRLYKYPICTSKARA